MAYEFKHRRLVEFADTDMAGIVHFTKFFHYLEQAEHAFYRSLGLSVTMDLDGRRISFPRLRAACDFLKPLKFEQEIEVHLLVREKKAKTLTFDFIIRNLSSDPAEEAARGEMVVICVVKDLAAGTMKSTEIPRVIADRIDEAPRQLLQRKD